MSGHLIALIGLVAIMVLLLFAGCCQTLEERRMQREAVKHGAAHYDPKTGEFVWNDEVGGYQIVFPPKNPPTPEKP